MSSPVTAQKISKNTYLKRFHQVRQQSNQLCAPLEIEDYVAQPMTDVSPPKWHLAHTTWFFENFILVPHAREYQVYHPEYCFLFNSYYVSVGARWMRGERGFLTRPTVKDIYAYRVHVDEAMAKFFDQEVSEEVLNVFELGLQHEQQHQELLLYDIKYILGQNPLFPPYVDGDRLTSSKVTNSQWLSVSEGIYEIGHPGTDFHFDNEKGHHKVFLETFEIASHSVTIGEYLEFVQDGGYSETGLWLSEGWDWVVKNEVLSPLYWIMQDGGWYYYTLHGLVPLDLNEPVSHVSFYEADAFARWKGLRLPTEFEWEAACGIYGNASGNFVENNHFRPVTSEEPDFYGNLWEWTASAYRPYPRYAPPAGAIGEYNGKFMINQMVLRGGSYATAKDHIRKTYRNFFHPHLQWLFSGFRLAQSMEA